MKNKNLIFLFFVILIISVIFGVSLNAVQSQTLDEELNNLISDLNNSEYSWLINLNLGNASIFENFSRVEVYEKDSDVKIAEFENISENAIYKIFLNNLGENFSQSTFDLKSFGNVYYDYVVDPLYTTISITSIFDDGNISNTAACGDYVRDKTGSIAMTGRSSGSPGTPVSAYYYFNLSSIPAGATMTNITLNISVDSVSSATSCNIYNLDTDNNTNTATTLWTDAGDGTNYVSNSDFCQTVGFKLINLGTNATGNITNFNVSKGWFGIGIPTNMTCGLGTPPNMYFDTSENSSYSPTLLVTYTITSATATYYWVGLNNGNWTDASSWSATSGGAGGIGIPNETTAVVFDSGNLNDSIINSTFAGAIYSLNLSIGYNGTLESKLGWNKSLNVSKNIIISNGTLTHGDNSNAETYRLNMIVGGNFSLESAGVINATGRGYDSGQGPCPSTTCGNAACHGGMGFIDIPSSIRTNVYGSITQPVNLGSGGSGTSGGGAIFLNVTENFTIYGNISSKAPSGGSCARGSGGSIYLLTKNIGGNGNLNANGGDYETGGGGGRIAIILTTGTDFNSFTGNIIAYGGKQIYNGAAGTIYLKTASQTYGDLIIDNNGTSTTATTLISENVSGTIFDNITIKNSGQLNISIYNTSVATAPPVLTIYGNLNKTSSGSFSMGPNSSVVFAGTSNATIYGNLSFYNLNITKPGATLFFEKGGNRTKVNYNITGGLAVKGNSTHPVYLRSQIDGNKWAINFSGSWLDIDRADVMDSDNNASTINITAYQSVNSGNNFNWTFSSTIFCDEGDRSTDCILNHTYYFTNNEALPSFNNLILGTNGSIANYTTNCESTSHGCGFVMSVLGNFTMMTGSNITGGNISISVGNNFTLNSGAVVNASGLGWIAGQGPGGAGSNYNGGSHGGLGITSSRSNVNSLFNTYDSITSPADFGSGGTSTIGSGILFLNVSGYIILGGNINSIGKSASSWDSASSGGSIYIISNNISGNGNIKVEGGAGNSEWGSGGGGRIAIILTNGTDFNSFTGNITAFGGSGGGGAGTIYLKTATQTYGQLIVDNNNGISTTATTLISSNTTYNGISQIYNFDIINLSRAGALEIGTNATLNLTNTNLVGDRSINLRLIFQGNNLTFGSSFTFSNFTISQKNITGVTWNTSLTIADGGILTHEDNSQTEANKINLTILGNLTILSGGQINVTLKGYSSQRGIGNSTPYGGASYGGSGLKTGSSVVGVTYGSIISPINLGSGGSSTIGGGVCILNITGNLSSNGVIESIGKFASSWDSASSGGSIYIITNNISGSGNIKVNGGAGNIEWGSGGGGRIAVILTNGTDFNSFTGNITAFGGSGGGGAGTIYLKTASQNYGELIIDNNGSSTTATTLISENVSGATFGNVTIKNAGQLNISIFNFSNPGVGTNLTIYGNLNKTASGNFSAGVNSTIIFAGNSSFNSTIYGNFSFYNLNITKTGSYVFFEHGGNLTNPNFNITGALNIQGSASAPAFLRSRVDGTLWWMNFSGSSQDVDYVNVKDSNNTGTTINANLSYDISNNDGWLFVQDEDRLTTNATDYLMNVTEEMFNKTENNTHLTISTRGRPYNYLVGYWSFDGDKENTQGFNASDLAGNNEGTGFGNAVVNETGAIYGDALQLDGSGDYVNVSNFQAVYDFTTCIWIYPVSNSAWGPIVSLGNANTNKGWELYRKDTQSLILYVRNGTIPAAVEGGSTPINQWSYACAVFINSTRNSTLYVNGISVVSNLDGNYNPTYTHLDLRIGTRSDFWTFFNGSLDEVMIFNTSLTASEILEIYNNQSARFKSTGNQIVKQINISSGFDNLNLTANIEKEKSTNVSVRVSTWEVGKGYKDYDLGEKWLELDGNGDYISATTTQNNNSVCLWYKTRTSDWIHVVYNSTYTYNAGTGSGTEFPFNRTDNTILIGVNGSQFFNGSLSNVMLFNSSLNSTEIKRLYELGRDISGYDHNNLVSWWRLDKEINSTSVNDSKGTNLGTFAGNAFINETNDGLVGYWHFDEIVTSNFTDASGHCYDNETEILVREIVDCEEIGNEKNKVGSNRIARNKLIPDCNISNNTKYLNVSVNQINCYAEMAEWSTQSVDTGCPSGCVGSIPTLSVTNFSDDKIENFSVIFSPPNSRSRIYGLSAKSFTHPRIAEKFYENNLKEISNDKIINSEKICYKYSWKYFSELTDEEVATLNQKTGELEWQLPKEKQEFNYDKEMYKIILEDESDLLVSEKHKVYSLTKNSETSLVEIPTPILNNNFSYVQSEISLDKQRATKSWSFECSFNNSFAFGKNNSYLDKGINEILLNINEDKILNSCSDIFDFESISDLCFKNSSLSLSGANIFSSLLNINSNISPCEINVLNKTFASITISIYNDLFNCKCIDFFTLSANSSASFSENSDFETISLAAESSNSFTKDSITFANVNSNLSLNSKGTSTLTTISVIENSKNLDYLNFSEKDFSLQPITEVYSEFSDGKQIYFLDSENNPVKVVSILKENYSGKIYDVDVENDVVLVRRDKNNEKEKIATFDKDVASKVMHDVFTDFNNSKDNNYINFSINDSIAEDAVVASMVMHSLDERGLHGHPSSILGYGESSAFLNLENSEDKFKKEENKLCSLEISGEIFEYEATSEGSCGVWSGNSNNGTLTMTGAGPNLTAGVFDDAVSLDGVGDYVSVTMTQTNESVSLWYRNSTANSWTHAVYNSTYTYTGESKQFPFNRTDNTILIGVNGSQFFNGSIDEVMIFNRSLSQAEIKEIYVKGRAKFEIPEYRNYTTGMQVAIPTTTTNVLPEFKFLSNANNFYTPYLIGGVSGSTATAVDTITPNISYVSPTLENNTAIQDNSVFINVSVTENNPTNITFNLYNSSMNLNKTATDFNALTELTSTDSLSSGLVGLWHFNNDSAYGENATTIYDFSGLGNNGTVYGGTDTDSGLTTSSKFGAGAQMFDGAGDYVDVGTGAMTRPSTWTISEWIKPNTYSGATSCFSGSSGANYWGILVLGSSVRVYESNGVGSAIYFADTFNSANYPSNSYTFITATVNGSLIRYFRNGIEIGSGQTYTNGTASFGTSIFIGGGSDSYLNGSIDEVAIYNRSLSAQEVKELYHRGLQGLNMTEYNFTSLSEGTYHYNVTITDSANNKNTTTLRTQIIDSVKPNISLVTPTFENGSYTNSNSIYVNVSTNDSNEHSAFIDFNGSLVGWWKMDEVNSSGDVYDNSSYGNHGIAYGNANQTASGKRGKAFTFDGGGDYINVSHKTYLDIGNNLTVLTWIKVNNVGSTFDYIVGKDQAFITDGWHLAYESGDTIRVGMYNPGDYHISTTGILTRGQWYNVGLMFNGTYLSVYVNGVLNNSVACSLGTAETTYPLYIGSQRLGTRDFNGSLDDVMIFNRALSASEILSLYNASAPKYGVANNFTNLPDGTYNYTAYVQDSAGNVNKTTIRHIFVDTSQPFTQFETPTPANGSQQGGNQNSIFINATSNDTQANVSTFVDWDNSLVGWWRMDDINSSGDPTDYLGRCYDNETKILVREIVDCDFEENNANVQKNNLKEISDDNLENEKNKNNFQEKNSLGFSTSQEEINSVENKKGSNRMVEPNSPILSNIICKEKKYLNISVDSNKSDAGMAEWLLQLTDPECPLGYEGSIPSARVLNFSDDKINTSEKICYKYSWKYFSELTDEKVATLNSKNKKLEWQTPTEKQIFENNAEMFKIILEDESDLLVSEKHKVYSDSLEVEKNKNNFQEKNSLGFSTSQEEINAVENKKGSNRMVEPNLLIPSYNNCREWKYLNISINSSNCVGVAEWLLQLVDTKCPLGSVGSIPSARVLNFSLQPITEVYSDFENGKEIYFMNSENKPVKVVSISKENYSGKIYDVDVENDIVLVKRLNGNSFWSGNSNGTKVGNAVQNATGRIGKSFSFDGDGDYIRTNINFSNASLGSVCAWAKTNTLLGEHIIVGESGDLRPGIYHNGATLTWWDGSSGQINSAFTTNWTYLCLVLDVPNIYGYTNGNLIGSSNTAVAGNGGLWIIGSLPGAYNFNGSIDDVMIFNRSLSASEISALYANQSSRYFNVNFTDLSDATHTFKVYTQDISGNVNYTDKRYVQVDVTPPVVTAIQPVSSANYYAPAMDFNVSASDSKGIDTCMFSLNATANVTMSAFNSTWFNYSYTNLIHGMHNLTFSCNDTMGNLGTATALNFNVTFTDLRIEYVTLPSTIFSNATLIYVNISNEGPPPAYLINVTCSLGGTIFDSKEIPSIGVNETYLTNCTLTTTSGQNKILNVTVDPIKVVLEKNETNNENITYFNVSELGTIDAYDLEDDDENKFFWFDAEDEPLPDETNTYFFANYTQDNSSAPVLNANCNITLSGGNETGTASINMSYNSTAKFYYYNKTFNYAGNYSWATRCSKAFYEMLDVSGIARIRIPLYNQTSWGNTTSKTFVNYNELVNLTANISQFGIDTAKIGYNVSLVWVQISIPNSTKINYSLSGNPAGGIWNLTYNPNGVLGDHWLIYFANLTNGHQVIKTILGNFSVQNISISIATLSVANTTNSIIMNGQINRFNGSNYYSVENNLFNIKLNNVLVSSDTYNYSATNMTLGYGDGNVNISSSIKLNLTSQGISHSYTDGFSGSTYAIDSEEYNNLGKVDGSSGRIFEGDQMNLSTGNITYRFDSMTTFYNASVYATTQTSQDEPGANTSVWYSLNNSTWTILGSSISQGAYIGGVIPVDRYSAFYVRLQSDHSGGLENPIDKFEVNYTHYNHSNLGIYYSRNITLPNVSYTVLKWSRNLNEGTTKIQLRESDDGMTWGSWSSNYTNYLDNDISSFTKDYLQFRAILETTNLSKTPELLEVDVRFFNASTNSTGGYNYTITIPTDNLGVLPLDVSVVENSITGIVGTNTTSVTIWALTTLPYVSSSNYTGSSTNHSVVTNFTRSDTGGLINGSINISVWNGTGVNFSVQKSKSCNNTDNCLGSWIVPTDLAYGNYTIYINGSNETGYYRNGSVIIAEYLEEKNTSGTLNVLNKSIADLTAGVNYGFSWNATLTNTGHSSMLSPHVYIHTAATHTDIDSVTEVTPCTRIYPGQSCNTSMLVVVKGTASDGQKYIAWRANWTDNDGSVTGGNEYISDTDMFVNIALNATLDLNSTNVTKTIQHQKNGSFMFQVESVGTDSVTGIVLTFIQGNLTAETQNISSSWINISPSSINGLASGQNQNIIVNVSIPAQTLPGNYSGYINVTSGNNGYKKFNITVEVPYNYSWYFTTATNYTFNKSFSLNTAGEFANYTIYNIGNTNLTINISYIDHIAGSETNYSDYGTQLFEQNYLVNLTTTNPLSVNVTLGQTANVTLYQKGYSLSLDNAIVKTTFYNSTTSPTTRSILEKFWIYEQGPNVTDVYFLLDEVYGTIAEVNKNITIKVRTTDDISINLTTTIINISNSSAVVQSINATSLCGQFGQCIGGTDKTVANFTGNYSPTSAGIYNASVLIFDKYGNSFTSANYSFTAYGTATLNFSKNVSSFSTTKINKDNSDLFYVNYSINNTGNVTAYSVNITFVSNASIVVAPSENLFGDILAGTNTSKVFQVNVSKLTHSGDYNLTATLTWREPDNTISRLRLNITIVVWSNKSFTHTPGIVNLSVSSGSVNSTIVEINNTGNDELSNMSISCLSGEVCESMTFATNESAFSVDANSSRRINVSVTTSTGFFSGNYQGALNISDQNKSNSTTIYVQVPSTLTWTISTTSISSTKATSQTGNLEAVTINNSGNTNITFVLSSTNASIIGTNVSSLLVRKGYNTSFMINYTSPSVEGTYNETISITNSSANPTQRNVSVSLTTTAFNLSISWPTSVSKLTNITSGDLINFTANVTYGGSPVTSGLTWVVTINGSSCSNVNSSYSASTLLWNTNCTSPTIYGGINHNLSVSATHATYGEITSVSENSISSRDVSAPSFSITRNSVSINDNINIQFNVTDNVAVGSVSGVLTYPNTSQLNLTFTYSGGYYINNSFALTNAGEYLVNYSANDTIGNLNSSVDWFEVYDRYNWILKVVDYFSSGVTNLNLSLYRPNTTTILMSNYTNSTGGIRLNVNKRPYDLVVKISYDELRLFNVNFTNATQNNISLNIYRISGGDVYETITSYNPFIGFASNSTGFNSTSMNITFNYTGYDYDAASRLAIIKCSNWVYTNRSCNGSWSELSYTTRDINNLTLTGNSTGFSSYFLAENKCGNGLCETAYGETTSSCSTDCSTGSTTTTTSGGGGGGGGISSKTLKEIEKLLKGSINIGGIKLETTSIYKELFAGETTSVRIRLVNTLNQKNSITLSAEGDIVQFIFFESSLVELEPNEIRDVLIKIVAPKFIDAGNYDGDLVLSSGENRGKIPTTIRILSPEGKLLDVKIQPLNTRVSPGGTLRLQTDLLNLGKTKKVDVQFDLQLLDVNTGEIFARNEEAFAVETTISTVKELKIPAETPTGKYMVKATAYYSNIEQSMQASSIAYVNVDWPFFKRTLFGIPMWIYLSIFLFAGLLFAGYLYIRYLQYKGKRFKTAVDLGKLPQVTSHSAFVGKVAETGIRTFVDLNKLQMHTLIAGSTGSGKTISAQDIIEGALLHNKSVIIFDPTAQWTGFLRKAEDKEMIKRYKYFDMKPTDARAFNGSIKTIRDPFELINLKEYMNRPGEITVFNISHLTPQQIDVVVASTIEQVFKSEPEESQELKTLIVYDEVHRLLPKFGGSGQGFIQLERGAREFRKWGIGLVLISQVLSDFVGEIKANIGTEIQMGTRYEGDLERVSMKFGEDVLKSVVKEPIGTGLVVNAEYNNGRPYFVSFRPVLHNTRRLTNAELDKYEKYFEQIEDLDFQISQLTNLKIDVLDLQLELKLTKSKVKEGQFQMADMYLESLVPRITEQWKKLGKAPMHRVVEKIERAEVIEGIKKAKIEREKYVSKNPEKSLSLNEELSHLKKFLEEKKKLGKKTSNVELKIKSLEDRLKPFKGKVPEKDASGIKNEIGSIKKEIEII